MFSELDTIHVYSRAEAVADGVQVLVEGELADMARQLYKFPIYLTQSVHSLIEEAVDFRPNRNSWSGVLWDVLYMSRAVGQPINESATEFRVLIMHKGNMVEHRMVIECQPTDVDNPAPCLTVRLWGED